MKLTTVTILALLMATSAASDTPENALLAQSVTAWENAQQASDPAERLAALQAAHSAINTILEDHDQSDLAANITLGQGGLPFSQSELVEAISNAQAEISQDSDTESVNDVIATATRLLETAASLEVAELEVALQAYLMMREADAMLTSAPERFPFARNLDVLETTDVFQQRAELMTEASQQVVNLCDGNLPKSCLLLEAELIARGIGDDDTRRRELIEIASELARTGQVVEAERIARELEDDEKRRSALIVIAVVLAETGQVVEAQEMLSEVERLARGIADDRDRSIALSRLAVALAETGQVVEAQEMLSEVERIA